MNEQRMDRNEENVGIEQSNMIHKISRESPMSTDYHWIFDNSNAKTAHYPNTKSTIKSTKKSNIHLPTHKNRSNFNIFEVQKTLWATENQKPIFGCSRALYKLIHNNTNTNTNKSWAIFHFDIFEYIFLRIRMLVFAVLYLCCTLAQSMVSNIVCILVFIANFCVFHI